MPHQRQLPAEIVVIGIDPGYRITGYGIIRINTAHCKVKHCNVTTSETQSTVDVNIKSTVELVSSGIIKSPLRASEAELLLNLGNKLAKIVNLHQPVVAVFEQVFYTRNAQTAIKLAKALGVAQYITSHCCRLSRTYATRFIKKIVSGDGTATKDLMQQQVKSQLNTNLHFAYDQTDALAAALCYWATDYLLDNFFGANCNLSKCN